MNCDPASLARAAACFCFPRGMVGKVATSLACEWVNATPDTVDEVILDDGSGGFWLIVVDTSGNVGTVSSAGPATADVILDDGAGGFWKLIVDALGNRGTTTDAGPSTVPPTIDDGTGTIWTLVVDPAGNLGATS